MVKGPGTRRPAHPRSRGEHTDPGYGFPYDYGSSPLARGTQFSRFAFLYGDRLIPARAGNTASFCAAELHVEAHPRSRGEHAASFPVRSRYNGSSPLARGTRRHLSAAHGGSRLIPARAGNTRSFCGSWVWLPAHPRSRGEHDARGFGAQRDRGSSPLARGTLRKFAGGHLGFRLIPARAGNTPVMMFTASEITAHPRSRGEHTYCVARARLTTGSSPLARGTQRQASGSERAKRLIPARAGNT